MRALAFLPILLLLPLGGCAGAGIAAGVEAASITVFGRGVVDAGVSAVTGLDCSVVRLDRRQTYCAPREQLPGAQLFCTRTLGTVECWANPEDLTAATRAVADAPGLTPEQVRQVHARWPKSLNITRE